MVSIKHLILGMLPTALAGRLRAWRVGRLIRTFPVRDVVHDYGGGPLRVHLADPLAQGWYDHDWAELPEIAALRRTRLAPGARVFDVGAHQGVVAMMLAREAGPGGLVVAVEPSPHNAGVAKKNRELNGMRQIQVVQAAVSDRAGALTFNASLNGQLDDGSGAWGRMRVEATTLDGLAERFGLPAVVFLDVEGAECPALAGGPRVLEFGADFFVEVHVGCGLEKLGGSVQRLLSFFPRERYTLLGRAEADSEFRPLAENDALTRERFFMLALAKAG